MGLIISRFRGKKSTIEVLEDIDKNINRLQKNRKENQDRQKQIATSLIIYSIILYIISAIIFFLVYFPDTWPLRLLYSLPLLAFPILIWCVRKLLHWYFVKRITGNDLALRDLREQKKQILEDVMETETYKKAKEILEKFDPSRFKKLEINEQSSTSTPFGTPGTSLVQRKVVVSQPPSQSNTPQQQQPKVLATPITRHLTTSSARPTPNPFGNTPLRPPPSAFTPATSTGGRGQGQPTQPQLQQQMVRAQTVVPQSMLPQMGRGYVPPGPPMPRSILPRDRGALDKIMDYLVGDGPENRYALVCRMCSSHNGMALKEEFEYMTFRCCYCYALNPARKQRPMAPRMEFFTPQQGMKQTAPDESNSDESSDDEEDGEDEDAVNKETKAVNEEKTEVKSLMPSSVSSVQQTQAGLSGAGNNKNSLRSKLPISGVGAKPVPVKSQNVAVNVTKGGPAASSPGQQTQSRLLQPQSQQQPSRLPMASKVAQNMVTTLHDKKSDQARLPTAHKTAQNMALSEDDIKTEPVSAGKQVAPVSTGSVSSSSLPVVDDNKKKDSVDVKDDRVNVKSNINNFVKGETVPNAKAHDSTLGDGVSEDYEVVDASDVGNSESDSVGVEDKIMGDVRQEGDSVWSS